MKHLTRVRQMRKRFSLTQGELAHLLGIYQGNISRLESGETPPDLEAAQGLQLIFGICLHDLFPVLIDKIEDAVMRRAAELSTKPKFDTPEKLSLFEGMVSRARPKSHDL